MESPIRQQVRSIEAERGRDILAKMNERLAEDAKDSERPNRLADQISDPDSKVLVDKALRIINIIREKAGAKPIDDLPLAVTGDSGHCVLARAFSEGQASVPGGAIAWGDEVWRDAAREAFGEGNLNYSAESKTMGEVVNAFDSGKLWPYIENAEEREMKRREWEKDEQKKAEADASQG